MKTIIRFSCRSCLDGATFLSAVEISIAKQAAGLNALIKQRCDYPPLGLNGCLRAWLQGGKHVPWLPTRLTPPLNHGVYT